MTLKELAEELIAANRENRTDGLLEAHYHPDAVSVEATPMPGTDTAECVGLEGIKGKHAWWDANMEFVEGAIEGPYLHGEDRFAVIFNSTFKEKASGTLMPMAEVAVYHVADGKIVREEFFYTM
ncbi:MAG: nuclear transport factor 2 family protein [Pseudomonadota bacterium]